MKASRKTVHDQFFLFNFWQKLHILPRNEGTIKIKL